MRNVYIPNASSINMLPSERGTMVDFVPITLKSISIPESVTSIGEMAFKDCTCLTIYGTAGSYEETYAKENNISFCEVAD